MFTIDIDIAQYATLWLAVAAARAWMLEAKRSVTIYKDGKPERFLRY